MSKPRFSQLAIGELNPDFLSKRIQNYLTLKHGVHVNWSHIAILVEGFEGRQAKFNGVWDHTGRGFEQCSLAEALDQGHAVIRRITPLKVYCPYEALGWLRGKRGSWYANLQYALYVLPPSAARYAGKLLPKFLRKLFANGRALGVCSETSGYFMLDNCVGAEENQALVDGDRLDPYQAVVEAEKYRDEDGQG